MTFLARAATTALTGLAIFGFASAAFAGTSDHDAHVRLAEAIKDVGVRFYVNPDQCDDTPALGWYQGMGPMLVVCQEKHLSTTVEDQVEWTEEDYDTLRHEAVHLVQDCMDGKLNQQLQAYTKDPKKTVLDVLGPEAMVRIQGIYAMEDQAQHVVRMEWEAFSIASLNKPDAQVNMIKTFCGVK